MTSRTTKIEVPILARVEGEGALSLTIKNNTIETIQLRIYEPPRLFEKFLEGREPNEVIDAVARICGICPVAYQMSAVHAIESIFDLQITPWVRELRRLLYCGEWMESHGIHIHMLALPDFLGYNSVMEMAKDHPDIVSRGMTLHALGNELMALIGKRSVNPVSVCVGGFYKALDPSEVKKVCDKFIAHLPMAEELLRWSATLPLPDITQAFTCVSLHHPSEYAMNEGRIISSSGLDIDNTDFDQHFKETQVAYSTALHCTLDGKSYLTGPLARVNNNYAELPAQVKQKIEQCGIPFPSQNMFHSIVARAIEIYYAMHEAIRIMQNYTVDTAHVDYIAQAGVGFGATEAPRGLLWHRYELDANGLVKTSRIVPPTSQNQARIEEDLRLSLEKYGLEHSDQELRLHSEMTIRNYDPCISCSTHFLTLNVNRS